MRPARDRRKSIHAFGIQPSDTLQQRLDKLFGMRSLMIYN
jgi:hypothetical protein